MSMKAEDGSTQFTYDKGNMLVSVHTCGVVGC